MRTGLFLLAGFLLLAASLVLARLFAPSYPASTTWATIGFIVAWLALTSFNLWVGVTKAGYGVVEELPIWLLLFGVPALVAVLARWKLG
jgi:hypothetical protein